MLLNNIALKRIKCPVCLAVNIAGWQSTTCVYCGTTLGGNTQEEEGATSDNHKCDEESINL